MLWIQWIRHNWRELAQGIKLQAPCELGAPGQQGFDRATISTQRGQIADWVLSCRDGTRIHVRQFPDGRFVVHRDRYDSKQGLGQTISHLMVETVVGPALGEWTCESCTDANSWSDYYRRLKEKASYASSSSIQ